MKTQNPAARQRWRRQPGAIIRVVIVISLAAPLTGCGQLGPLYLPSPANEVITRPAADTPSTNPPAPTPEPQTP